MNPDLIASKYMNCAQCKFNVKQWSNAIEMCEEAMRIDAGNSKGVMIRKR